MAYCLDRGENQLPALSQLNVKDLFKGHPRDCLKCSGMCAAPLENRAGKKMNCLHPNTPSQQIPGQGQNSTTALPAMGLLIIQHNVRL